MYVDYDMLCEAAFLAVEFIDAVLGSGREYFGIKVGCCLLSSRKFPPSRKWVFVAGSERLT